MKGNHQIKRIILVGKAASGKDFAKNILTEAGFVYAVTYTTRPMRVGEVDGVDYNFISDKEFERYIELDEMYEYVKFNNWYYGTSIKDINDDKTNIFIMTPSGISKLSKEDRKESYVIYIDTPDEVRIARLKERNDTNDSIDRRIAADNKDFHDFNDYDYRLSGNSFKDYTIINLANLKLKGDT